MFLTVEESGLLFSREEWTNTCSEMQLDKLLTKRLKANTYTYFLNSLTDQHFVFVYEIRSYTLILTILFYCVDLPFELQIQAFMYSLICTQIMHLAYLQM